VIAEHSTVNQSSAESAIANRHQHLRRIWGWDEVYAIAEETMQQGNGAARQRDLYKRTSSLEDVVDFVVRQTAKGTTAV